MTPDLVVSGDQDTDVHAFPVRPLADLSRDPDFEALAMVDAAIPAVAAEDHVGDVGRLVVRPARWVESGAGCKRLLAVPRPDMILIGEDRVCRRRQHGRHAVPEPERALADFPDRMQVM